VGRGRDGRLLAERADAAARHQLQRDQRQGARAAEVGKVPRAYWDWEPMLRDNKAGFFPYTPSTNILYGLREALAMMRDEGLETSGRGHERFGRATRARVKAWGLDILAQNPAEYSGVLTAVVMPEGRDADAFRQLVLERFDMSLGTGLGKMKGKIFRIGHLGDFNDLMLAGTLSGVEMGFVLAGVPHKSGGDSRRWSSSPAIRYSPPCKAHHPQREP
jgi:alanine-glyoxylate transaminase/serine-glyoxylate transaminase/serine-pyruvate transaminase